MKHYCWYHVVCVFKHPKKALFGTLRREIGAIFRDLCCQKGIDLVEGYIVRGHTHMLLMIPPKFSVSNTVGFLDGKIFDPDISEVQACTEKFTGRHFWA
ncbi:IS200/IS605 family transposase [Microbulbifer sp. MLAF003]|uniref:IS200/IS605 family transposase n=1 Tax=Microbulbifer sp. MLAF003 TaxID=3032582 RepID=UPI00334079E8